MSETHVEMTEEPAEKSILGKRKDVEDDTEEVKNRAFTMTPKQQERMAFVIGMTMKEFQDLHANVVLWCKEDDKRLKAARSLEAKEAVKNLTKAQLVEKGVDIEIIAKEMNQRNAKASERRADLKMNEKLNKELKEREAQLEDVYKVNGMEPPPPSEAYETMFPKKTENAASDVSV